MSSTPEAAPAERPPPSTRLASSAAEVAERIAAGQTNATSQASSRSLWLIIKTNVFTRFNAILGALFVLILITGSLADGLFGVVLVVNSAIGIVQEYLAKRKLDRLALLNSPTTRVIRDGELDRGADRGRGSRRPHRAAHRRPGARRRVDADDVRAGDRRVEPDRRGGRHREVGGRRGAVRHHGGRRASAGSAPPPSGRDAYINKIAAEAKKFTKTRSEIQESVNKLLKYITWVIVIALPLQLWSQWRAIGDQGWQQVVIRSTGGLVGLVPEGLVLLTSVAFLLAAVQLTRQQVLVQELPAVEGLARVNVVCLDKTGTLTVGDIAYEDCEPCGDLTKDEITEALGALADDPNANGTLQGGGRRRCRRRPAGTARSPSPSTRRASGAPPRSPTAGRWCSAHQTCCCPRTDPLRDRVSELAATGRRVLLLGRTDAPLVGQELPAGIEPISLVTLTEQVRPDAKDTLNYFKDQDVEIKIISGDNPDDRGRHRAPRGPGARARRGRRRPDHRRGAGGAATSSSSAPRCSAGSRPNRSARSCRRCSATGMSWR